MEQLCVPLHQWFHQAFKTESMKHTRQIGAYFFHKAESVLCLPGQVAVQIKRQEQRPHRQIVRPADKPCKHRNVLRRERSMTGRIDSDRNVLQIALRQIRPDQCVERSELLLGLRQIPAASMRGTKIIFRCSRRKEHRARINITTGNSNRRSICKNADF